MQTKMFCDFCFVFLSSEREGQGSGRSCLRSQWASGLLC